MSGSWEHEGRGGEGRGGEGRGGEGRGGEGRGGSSEWEGRGGRFSGRTCIVYPLSNNAHTVVKIYKYPNKGGTTVVYALLIL